MNRLRSVIVAIVLVVLISNANAAATPTHTPTVTVTTSQTATVTVTPTIDINSIDHFEIMMPDGPIISVGTYYLVSVYAKSVINSTVTSYYNPVYLSCPELDYTSPTESTLNVSGGYAYYDYLSPTAAWKCDSFLAGVSEVYIKLYRDTSVITSAALFVSDNPSDIPGSSTGHFGESSNLYVIGGSVSNIIALGSNQEHRPGGTDRNDSGIFTGDGYEGNNAIQIVSQPMNIYVKATDAYWNVVASENSNFTILTSPSTSVEYGMILSLTNGEKSYTLTFQQADDYTVIIDSDNTGITDYTSPYQITVVDPTATMTITPTITETTTPSSTVTMSSTPTVTPTLTITPTVTEIATPSSTVTTSHTSTTTLTFTLTTTMTETEGTGTVTPTITLTPTIAETKTPSSTVTITATQTSTPDESNDYSTVTMTVTKTVTEDIRYIKPKESNPVVIRRSVFHPSYQAPMQIGVHLSYTQHVTIKIYNLRGRLIKTVADQVVDAGSFETIWEGINRNGLVVSSGIYIIHIKTAEVDEIRKMAVIR